MRPFVESGENAPRLWKRWRMLGKPTFVDFSRQRSREKEIATRRWKYDKLSVVKAFTLRDLSLHFLTPYERILRLPTSD